jgi:nucleoside-diphosphate-sugar epimerase
MASKLFDLSGKVAIVTGGNGGIGLGMARGLAAAGAAIAIVGRDEAKSNAAVTELKQSGAKAISVLADVTGEAAVSAMAERVRRGLGRIDILVNNAGINIRKPPDALSLAEWNSVIDTNLTSAFLCSRAVHPAMKAAGGGKIINIGSMMSIFGASLCRQQGRHRAIHPLLRGRLGHRQHPDQRGTAGMDRYRSDEARPRAGRRPSRQGAGPYACGALGRLGRLRRHRGVSLIRCVGLCDRHCHPHRRRLLDNGLARRAARPQRPLLSP